MIKGMNIGLSAGLATKSPDWPFRGQERKEAIRAYCNGVWEVIDPNRRVVLESGEEGGVRWVKTHRYEVIDLGVDDAYAASNRQRNGGKWSGVKSAGVIDKRVPDQAAPSSHSRAKTVVQKMATYLASQPDGAMVAEISKAIGESSDLVGRLARKAQFEIAGQGTKGNSYRYRLAKVEAPV